MKVTDGVNMLNGWEDGCHIKGLDAYPHYEARKRFPTKKHMLVACPRLCAQIVDVVFSRKRRPICLNIRSRDECDFCWAYNLVRKREVPESFKPQISEEINYWESVRNTKNVQLQR